MKRSFWIRFLVLMVGMGQSVSWAQSTSTSLKADTTQYKQPSATTHLPSSQTQTPSKKNTGLKPSSTQQPGLLNPNKSKNQKYVPSSKVKISDPKIQFNDKPKPIMTSPFTPPSTKTPTSPITKTPAKTPTSPITKTPTSPVTKPPAKTPPPPNTKMPTSPSKTQLPQMETPQIKQPQYKIPTTRVGDDSAPQQYQYVLTVRRSN